MGRRTAGGGSARSRIISRWVVRMTVAALTVTVAVALPSGSAPAATTPVVYVSAAGSDTAAGTTPETAWRTLERVQRAADAGDLGPGSQVLFRRGDRFPGGLTLRAGSSGTQASPLVLSAYGTGPLPVLTRAVRVTGWTRSGTNRWTAPCPGCTTRPNLLTLSGRPQGLARWPNADSGDGYRYITSASGRTRLTDSTLPATPNWTGGEVAVRSVPWVIDRLPITAHSGGTLTFGSAANYDLTPGYGYFVQNHPAALDRPGEWVYDATARTLTLFSAADPNRLTVQVGGPSAVITLDGASDVTLRNLELSGGGPANLRGTGCRRVALNDVTSKLTGGTGIELSGCSDATLRYVRVRDALDRGLALSGCTRCSTRNALVSDIATIAGMGGDGDGRYVGVQLGPAGSLELSRVERIGYLAVDAGKPGAVVRRNAIRAFNQVKVDGSGIYAYRSSDITITQNLVADAPGSTAGIPWGTVGTNGIYIDDDTQRVQVRDNVVSSIGGAGIYLHNTKDVAVTGNTVISPGENALQLIDDDLGTFSVTGTTVTGNTVVLDRPGANAVDAAGLGSGFLSGLGRIDDNTYCGVFTDPPFRTQQAGTRVGFNLSGWRAQTGHDRASTSCAYRSPGFRETGTVGAQRVTNPSFDTGIAGWFGWPDTALRAAWTASGINGGGLSVSNSGAAPMIHIDTTLGAVTAGSTMRLRLSARGGAVERQLRVYLRQGGSPYRPVTDAIALAAGAQAVTHQVYLPVLRDEQDTVLIVELEGADAVAVLDDVTVHQVTGSPVKPADVMRVETNPAATPRTVTLDGQAYTDPKGTSYPAGSALTVPPFGSVVLFRR